MRKVVVSWMLEVCEEEKCNKLVLSNKHSTDKVAFVIYGTEISQVEE